MTLSMAYDGQSKVWGHGFLYRAQSSCVLINRTRHQKLGSSRNNRNSATSSGSRRPMYTDAVTYKKWQESQSCISNQSLALTIWAIGVRTSLSKDDDNHRRLNIVHVGTYDRKIQPKNEHDSGIMI